ncbi:MAG: hypothetical protein LBJ16_02745, partial [Holosporaceae bacterium]|nr:hypothetical protein [Holosporaceae bacterium]
YHMYTAVLRSVCSYKFLEISLFRKKSIRSSGNFCVVLRCYDLYCTTCAIKFARRRIARSETCLSTDCRHQTAM